MAPCLAASRLAEASTSYPTATSGRVRQRASHTRMHASRMVRSGSFADTAHFAHLQPSVPVCSLRKEKKKLAKTIKSHRKRLERVLGSAGALTCDTSLAEVHAELKRLNELLSRDAPAAASMPTRINDGSSSSSSSDSSDSECESQGQHARLQVATQPQPGFARGSINTLLSVADLEVPELDDITPVCYSTPGRVLVCQGSKCQARGAADLLRRVSHLTSASEGIDVLPCKCMGKCGQAPALRVKAEGETSVLVGGVAPAELPAILQQRFG